MHSKTPQSRRTAEAGFSLIEIMVAVLIMGLLAVVVAGAVIPQFNQSQAVKARADITALENALELYRLQMLSYPTIEQGLDALVSAPDGLSSPERYPSEGFIRRLPLDPWGSPYQYEYPGQNGTVDVYSYGADGQPGGEDLDADIGNWTIE
ncbi:MAG: type II secretion system major pseudopilin GspG [Pseudomonadota bacterium]